MKTNKEIITEIIEDLDLIFSTHARSKINKEKLISCWSEYFQKEYEFYGYKTDKTLSAAYKKIFKNINSKPLSEPWKAYILRLYKYKYCPKCTKLLELKNFNKSKQSVSGVYGICKICDKEKKLNLDIKKSYRTPSWLTEDDIWMIQEIYSFAKLREESTGIKWHVDHIIPLHGKLVSGLHIPQNLQVIPAERNLSKSNNFCNN